MNEKKPTLHLQQGDVSSNQLLLFLSFLTPNYDILKIEFEPYRPLNI